MTDEMKTLVELLRSPAKVAGLAAALESVLADAEHYVVNAYRHGYGSEQMDDDKCPVCRARAALAGSTAALDAVREEAWCKGWEAGRRASLRATRDVRDDLRGSDLSPGTVCQVVEDAIASMCCARHRDKEGES